MSDLSAEAVGEALELWADILGPTEEILPDHMQIILAAAREWLADREGSTEPEPFIGEQPHDYIVIRSGEGPTTKSVQNGSELVVTDEMVERAAEAMDDSLTMLGVDPGERPDHGGPTTAEVLARAALVAALGGDE